MDIKVLREYDDENTTISRVFVDGVPFCDGLEDEYREEKKHGETRIPAGRYKVTLRNKGGFHSRYSNKFGNMHEGMLEISNVPNFEHVLIHVGNWETDTAGCLLVGVLSYKKAAEGNLMVTSSTVTYKRLYKKVIGSAKTDNLFIEYIDYDR